MERHACLSLTCMAGQAKAWLVTFARVGLVRFFSVKHKQGKNQNQWLNIWYKVRYRQLDTFCRFRIAYCRSMVRSYNVGTIFGPTLLRTMFVKGSQNVRTMAKRVRSMFVQCSTKGRTIFLAIVRTLSGHCTNIVPWVSEIGKFTRSLIYANQKKQAKFCTFFGHNLNWFRL